MLKTPSVNNEKLAVVKFYGYYHQRKRNVQSPSLVLCTKLLDLLNKGCYKILRCFVPDN